MRLAFLVLLLVNALLFVWARGDWGNPAAGREPERIGRQIAPEKLRSVAALADVAGVAPAVPPVCQRIEGLSATEAATLGNVLAALSDWAITPHTPLEAPTYRVAIPALATRALAEKKQVELRQLGVEEGQVVTHAADGPYAVSLGVFRDPQRAEDFLQALARKGVRSARLIPRPAVVEKHALEVRAPAAALDQKLPELLTALPDARRVDCTPP
jgi:hypothetical protein